jgi:hypothetical protein
MKIANIVTRILLVIFVTFGANMFVHLIPMPPHLNARL